MESNRNLPEGWRLRNRERSWQEWTEMVKEENNATEKDNNKNKTYKKTKPNITDKPNRKVKEEDANKDEVKTNNKNNKAKTIVESIKEWKDKI